MIFHTLIYQILLSNAQTQGFYHKYMNLAFSLINVRAGRRSSHDYTVQKAKGQTLQTLLTGKRIGVFHDFGATLRWQTATSLSIKEFAAVVKAWRVQMMK